MAAVHASGTSDNIMMMSGRGTACALGGAMRGLGGLASRLLSLVILRWGRREVMGAHCKRCAVCVCVCVCVCGRDREMGM